MHCWKPGKERLQKHKSIKNSLASKKSTSANVKLQWTSRKELQRDFKKKDLQEN